MLDSFDELLGAAMIHHETARGLAKSVMIGERTSLEIVEHYLARADASDLNAFTLIDRQGALAAAQGVDDARRAGQELGVLAGVPVAVKDLIDQQGRITTAGSSFYRKVPDHSATVIRRLDQAGAVIIGRTGLHEFAFGFTSENDWFGPVRNPWDPRTSPGGSSGGSAVATAAGLASVTLGTDTGGSVRGPAALCGVVGLKPTHGRVPLTGVFPLAPSLDTAGPIARSVGDAAQLYQVIAGFDPSDPWSESRHVREPGPAADPARLRIGVPQPWVSKGPVQKAIRDSFWLAVDRLESVGARVEEFASDQLQPAPELTPSVAGEVASVHREFRSNPNNRYGPVVEARMRIADAVTLDEYIAALEWRARLRQAFAGAFEAYDLLITPAVGAREKVIGEDEIDIDGQPQHFRFVLSWFSALVNHAGLPALVLPLQTSAPGVPPAIQFIAPWWQEHTLLEVGLMMEQSGLSAVVAPPGF